MFSRSAFTLTELLIAVTITTMIILAVSSVDSMARGFFLDMQRRSSVQDELKIAMEHITKYVQLGNGDPYGTANAGFSLPAGDGGSQLTVRQDSDDDGRPDTTHSYSLASNIITDTITLIDGTVITDDITDAHITNLVFNEVISNTSCSYPNAVEITITGREKPAAGPGLDNPEGTLTSTVVLRAMACN